MRSVFLDYDTVSCNGDLDPASLLNTAPGLELRPHTAQANVAGTISGATVVILNKLCVDRATMERTPSLKLITLAAALRAGTIGGAAIDVLPQEPPVDGNPLLDPDLPNLLVTPHIAWAARAARQRCLDEMAANIADFLRGGQRGRVV